jgi:mono/diheme cytochrome c family protein
MKKAIIAAILGLSIWACGSETTSGGTVATAAAPDGKKIFKTYCVTCHGQDGKMQMNGAKDLTLSELSLEDRIQLITNGRNTMLSFKSTLSPRQIEAVAAYTMEFSGE